MTELFRRLLRTPQGALGIALLAILAAVCVLGPWLAPYDPEKMDFLGRFRAPGWHNWLGADQFGRDVLSRLLVGARATIPHGPDRHADRQRRRRGDRHGLGLSRRQADEIDHAHQRRRHGDPGPADGAAARQHARQWRRQCDARHRRRRSRRAWPASRARSRWRCAIRTTSSAAIARGEGASWIIFREMLPNVMAPIVVETTIRVSFAVMLFATLSFLGLGAQPPASEWGLMVADARQYMHQAPWMLIGAVSRDRARGHRLQPARRRPARCAQPAGRAMTSVLAIRDYTLDYVTAIRRGACARRHVARDCAGRGAGPGRRIRLGQDFARLGHHALSAGQCPRGLGFARARRHRSAACRARNVDRHPRPPASAWCSRIPRRRSTRR